MADEPISHNEAWSVAHMKAAESNLARCYIDLRKAAAKCVVENRLTDLEKLRDICETND